MKRTNLCLINYNCDDFAGQVQVVFKVVIIDDLATWLVRDDLDGCTGRPRDRHGGIHADIVVDYEFDSLAPRGR